MNKLKKHSVQTIQDMNGKVDAFRPGAVRALCSITDPSTLMSIERYLKQAIVDKNPAVASAALISSFHLADQAFDVIKGNIQFLQ